MRTVFKPSSPFLLSFSRTDVGFQLQTELRVLSLVIQSWICSCSFISIAILMIPNFFLCCVQRFSYSQFHVWKKPSLFSTMLSELREGSLLKGSMPFHSPTSILLPKIHVILLIWCTFMQTRIQTHLNAVLLEQQFLQVRNDCASVGALTDGD